MNYSKDKEIVKELVIINELDLKQFLKLFWDKKLFITFMIIIFACAGIVKIKFFTTPVYQAVGKMICARNEETISEGTMVTQTELTTTSSLAETYAELIKSDLVVAKVIQNLKLDMTINELKKSVQLNPLTGVYYEISLKSTDQQNVAGILNEFMRVFSEEVKNFYEIDGIYVVDEAMTPNTAINMNIVKNAVLFAGVGAGIAGCIIMFAFAFNSTVTNSDQIKRYTKLTTLVSIPRYSGDEDLITLTDSKSPYAESIKILRTNLQYMYDKGELQTVAVTSSLPGEGKSWLTANLGVAFANTGKKTLIIDADMRRGRQHRLFHIRKIPGLSEFLRSTRGITDMVAIKGKKVRKGPVATGLGIINKHIKIDNIPAVADAIYKDDYFMTDVDGKSKIKSLKMKAYDEEVQLVIEPEKKTKGRKSTEKDIEKEEKNEKVPAKKRVDPKEDKLIKSTKTVSKKETVKEVARKVTTKKNDIKNDLVKKEPEKKVATKKTVTQKVSTKTSKNEPVKKTPVKRTTVTKKVENKNKKKSVSSKVKNKQEEDIPKISEFIRKTDIYNLDVISAGSERLESSELLSTGKFEDALEELKKQYDMIIVDTPPVSVVADGFLISRIVNTNIIVLKHGNTEINELNKIKTNIEEIGGNVIGTVINKVPDVNKKYYNTYYSKSAN